MKYLNVLHMEEMQAYRHTTNFQVEETTAGRVLHLCNL